ncbi:cell division protein SepF [bacterium]|nr:cell division protein SepF [bacterium]
MAVGDMIKSAIDFCVRGFEGKESDIDEMLDDEDYIEAEEYGVEGNRALAPSYNYQPREDRSNDLKVVNHPNYKGYEVIVMEPRSFEDAGQIVQNLKERKTIVLNLHLLDKIQCQRTIDFVCGAAHALNGNPQKVGDLVFVFTPSNVTLSVDMKEVQNRYGEAFMQMPM